MQCPFTVKVRCSKDGQTLFIQSVEGSHNHEINQVLFIAILYSAILALSSFIFRLLLNIFQDSVDSVELVYKRPKVC